MMCEQESKFTNTQPLFCRRAAGVPRASALCASARTDWKIWVFSHCSGALMLAAFGCRCSRPQNGLAPWLIDVISAPEAVRKQQRSHGRPDDPQQVEPAHCAVLSFALSPPP